MALPAATPENLEQFSKLLAERLAQSLGGKSGTSNFIFIDSYITKNIAVNDGISHLYLVVDSKIDLSNVSLRYCRKKRVKVRRSKDSPYYENEDMHRAHSTGWHHVWRLPISDQQPLILPILKSSTPDFVIGGNAYYEITVEGYDQFIDFATDDSFDTGYQNAEGNPVPVSSILNKMGGVCLIDTEGHQISNYATFRTHYDEDNGIWNIGK